MAAQKGKDLIVKIFDGTSFVTVAGLRKRLGEPWLIATVPGVGYRIGNEARG